MSYTILGKVEPQQKIRDVKIKDNFFFFCISNI